MKIVFIQPNVGFNGHTWEALGIGYLVSYLKKFYEKDLEISFFSAFYDSNKTIIESCQGADIIGFTCTSPQYKHALKLANILKRKNNLIVFGGVHPSALPNLVLQEDAVDIVVKGEGEKAFLEILKDIDRGTNMNKRIYSCDYIKDINTIPFPDRNIIKNERNIQQAYEDNGIRIASTFSARGCPFNCSFCCSNMVWEKLVRWRSSENILDEIEILIKNWNIQFLKFSDDTFTLSKQRILDFCEQKQIRKIKLPFGANARVDLIDEEILENLVDAGCKELWYGVESGSPKILKDMHKGTNINQIRRAFMLTKNFGIKTRAYFLLGMPNETIEDIKMTEKLCDDIQPDVVGFSLLAPFPSNEYFDYETMKDWDWSMFDEYNNNWVRTKTLTNQQLKEEQKRLIRKYQEKITFRQKKE